MTDAPTFTPARLRRRALGFFLLVPVLLVLSVVLLSNTDVLDLSGACFGGAVGLLIIGLKVRGDAKFLETVLTEPLAQWTFDRSEWAARMDRERRANPARHPKWIVVTLSAIGVAALIPIVIFPDSFSVVSALSFLSVVFMGVGLGLVAAKRNPTRMARERAARPFVAVALGGALVGEQLIDWRRPERLKAIAFDEVEHALRARVDIRIEGARRVADVLIPVPRSERSVALELARLWMSRMS